MKGRTRPITEPTYLFLQQKTAIMSQWWSSYLTQYFNIFRKTYSIDLDIYVFVHCSRFIWHKDRGLDFCMKGERDQAIT